LIGGDPAPCRGHHPARREFPIKHLAAAGHRRRQIDAQLG
jgi:hypothetical protein